MPQSSLTAWLQKSRTTSQAAQDTRQQKSQAETQGEGIAQLPTPPPSSQEVHDDRAWQASTAKDATKTTSPVDSVTTSKSTLPPNVHLRPCTKADIPAFKRLNSLLLPIPYPESFYREIMEDSLTNNITLLATWHDDPATISDPAAKGRLVGAIRCRLLAHPPTTNQQSNGHRSGASKGIGGEKSMLYISTLVLLSPYRSHGIATALLHELTVRTVDAYGIGSVGAHVWEANSDALEWYGKRGFRVVGREDGYYRRLSPQGAVVVQREVKVEDLLPRG
jgi:N-alpha-acetyltransferase 50